MVLAFTAMATALAATPVGTLTTHAGGPLAQPTTEVVRTAGLVRSTDVGTATVGTAVTRPAARSCTKPGGTLVAYGHSYLHSPRIGGASTSYAALAASALGARPVIRAVDRGTTADIERLVRQGPTRWKPGSAQLVVIDSGINDIGRRVPTAQWTASLARTLRAFGKAPVPVVLLVRPVRVARIGHPGANPKVVAAYAAAQRTVAARFSAVRIVDAGAGWNPLVDLSLDGLHPTQAGMRHLAAAVRNAWVRACRP